MNKKEIRAEFSVIRAIAQTNTLFNVAWHTEILKYNMANRKKLSQKKNPVCLTRCLIRTLEHWEFITRFLGQ